MRLITNIFISLLTFLTVLEASVAGEAGFINPVQSTTIQSESLHTTNANAPIEDSYREIFGSNVYHVSQQQMTRLLPFAEMKGMVSNAQSIDRLGTLGMPHKYLSRNSKVHATNPANDVRWVEAERYWLACFIDNYDQIRTLWNINNAYTEAMARSFARLYDRVFIAAALGSVSTGARVGATTAVALPDTQKFIASSKNLTSGAVTQKTRLKLHTLAQVKEHMSQTFAIQQGEMAVMAINAAQVTSLAEEERVTSRDYQSLQPLMSGELAAFYGFVFAQTELIPANEKRYRYNTTTGQVVSEVPSSGAAGAGQADMTTAEVGQFDRC